MAAGRRAAALEPVDPPTGQNARQSPDKRERRAAARRWFDRAITRALSHVSRVRFDVGIRRHLAVRGDRMLERQKGRSLEIVFERELPQFGGAVRRDLSCFAIALAVTPLVFAACMPEGNRAAIPFLILGDTVRRQSLVCLNRTDEDFVAEAGDAQRLLLLLFAYARSHE